MKGCSKGDMQGGGGEGVPFTTSSTVLLGLWSLRGAPTPTDWSTLTPAARETLPSISPTLWTAAILPQAGPGLLQLRDQSLRQQRGMGSGAGPFKGEKGSPGRGRGGKEGGEMDLSQH